MLDALYHTSEARSEFAATCEALAARARANAQAFLPNELWATEAATTPRTPPSPACAALGDGAEVPGVREAQASLTDAVEHLLRASDAPADELGAAVATALAKVELSRTQLSLASEAARKQLVAERAATEELRGALEEALEDAREAEAQLAAERQRANALEAHLQTLLARSSGADAV